MTEQEHEKYADCIRDRDSALARAEAAEECIVALEAERHVLRLAIQCIRFTIEESIRKVVEKDVKEVIGKLGAGTKETRQ